MKTLAETTPPENQDGLSRSLQRHSPKVMDRETAKTLADLVTQSYDIFNTYGKDPEALRSIYKAFETELAGINSESLQRVFKEWLRTKSRMPTPADILGLLGFETNQPKGPEHHVFESTPEQRQAYQKQMGKRVAWAKKNWNEMDEKMHAEIVLHIGRLALNKGNDRALDYIRYLQNFCGAPQDLKQRVFA